MLKLSTITNKAAELGLETQPCKLSGGRNGLFIKLEYAGRYGNARLHDHRVTDCIVEYLRRHKTSYEYRGNYTSLLVIEETTT